ncbi:MAG: allantoinase AllB [Verrucomicrobiota bacterium]
MSDHRLDLVVRGGTLVTPAGLRVADLGVAEGRIVAVGPGIDAPARRELDATGAHVLPGVIDAHVHFNEPGRTSWEGLATGSAALAAGGGTCFFDMPLNSEPPVTDAARLREKRRLAERRSRTDFALWGGLVPGNLDQLGGLREAGAIGLKAFMSESGIASFPRVDRRALRAGMKRAARLGLIVAVHAEDEAAAAAATRRLRAAGRTDAASYLRSRPPGVELAAIREALELSGETGCALHLVHVTTPEGLALAAAAKARGVDVTAETCPHYLLLNAADPVRLGAVAKCAPPLRSERRRRGLWAALRAGRVDTIGSDHSPAPPSLKRDPDYFALWGGIAGVQHGFELLLEATRRSPARDWPLLVAATSLAVARRFRLPAKGALAPGFDADFLLVRPAPSRRLAAGELLTRHPLSPYLGRRSHLRITHTFVRGHAVWADGRLTPRAPRAHFLAPSP